MSGKLTHAHRAMLSIAGYLVGGCVEDENHGLMLSSLARVLPDCETGPESVAPVRVAARQLVEASSRRDRSAAEIRLAQALHRYNQAAAGAYLAAWLEEAKAMGRRV